VCALEHAASIAVDVIASIITEYAKRIVDKAVRGEELSDWEGVPTHGGYEEDHEGQNGGARNQAGL